MAQRDKLVAYGSDLGAAFQVADDLLDTLATAEELGKTAGKDQAAGKATLVALHGIDEARRRADALSASAIAALDGFGEPAALLRALATYVISRRN